jgi:Replication-relaxation
MITDRDLSVLRALARYFVLNRQQIQRLCFDDDGDGRVTRRRLLKLVQSGVIQRQPLQMHDMDGGSPSSVYYPARRGLEILAEVLDDKRILLVSSQSPQPHHLRHWLAVSETHITIDNAIARQTEVSLDGWINEWDTVSPTATEPNLRYRLLTTLQESPRLCCAPDAAFLLSREGNKKVYYLEEDRNTSGVERVAASKTKGYAELAVRQWHRRHFMEATVPTFTVLMIAPTSRRRDHLRHAIHNKPGWELWRFAASTELTADSFLHAPILYRCDSNVGVPLVQPSVSPQIPTLDVECAS